MTTADEELELKTSGSISPRMQKRIDEAEEFTAFVQHHLDMMGTLPSIERARTDFPNMSVVRIKTELKAAGMKLEARGYTLSTKDYLDPLKLAVANSLLNLADKRSRSQKLKDFKVSVAEFNNWKKDPVFNHYLRERSENILGDSIPDVHLALVQSASNGDVSAMKLFYEITGRHGVQTQQNVNIQAMLTTLIEAVQELVPDPEVLKAIASRMQAATGGINSPMVKGELM